MRKGQFLSQVMKDKRKDHAAKLLNKLKHPLQLKILWLFSNEKNFCQDQMLNLQNNHQFALSLQDVLIVMKTNHLVHIMVFEVVISISDIIPPFTFPHRLRLHMEAYFKCLEEVELTWIEKMAAERPYVWQLDTVPCHKSRRTQC